MAAAEVRAAWQRTANRCFVQEDAKRAPKLASCQSSCATSKLVDTGSANAANEPDQAYVNDTQFNQKSSFSNRMPDSRWWLNLHPEHGFEKGLANEELNALEEKVEISDVSGENETCNCKGDGTLFGDENHDSYDYVHHDFEAGVEKKTSMKGMQEAYCKNSQAFSDYSLIEGVKPHPWWRTTDRYELACLVSQNALNHIENCHLPPPGKKYLGGGQPCADIGDDRINTGCFDWEAKPSGFSNLTVQAKGSLDSGFIHRNLRHLHFASDKSSSYTTIHESVTEQVFDGDHSKAQLMEALCHSQTRAREAEELAKKTYAEKEHIVALLLLQASQLVAYEQWFRRLQLETVNTSQIKNMDQVVSTHFPEAIPRILFEGRKLRNVNAKKEMLGKLRSDISKYAVAFALGLNLVGAGLFLGWTAGWMLPRL